ERNRQSLGLHSRRSRQSPSPSPVHLRASPAILLAGVNQKQATVRFSHPKRNYRTEEEVIGNINALFSQIR
ncbi:hypothetical protein U1Q18_037681, partial [Sarracenia purpurea var. burkii]